MNRVIISGRLTATPELKTTPSGKSVSSFRIAVDRNNGKDETDFLTVVTWDHTAEFVTKYLEKGRKIIVGGKLHTRSYNDANGNVRNVTEVYADSVEFADSAPAR